MGRSRDLADGTLAELNVDSNTLAVDATNNRVGIGITPSTKLDVSGTSRYTFNVDNAYTLQTSINAAGSAFADDYKNAAQHIWQTSGTERMRILSSGGITFNGDTATANALDDYEEGTWTPDLQFNGTSQSSYGSRTGGYVKIGRVVTATSRISGTTSATGVIKVFGLPYAPDSPDGTDAIQTCAIWSTTLAVPGTGYAIGRIDQDGNSYVQPMFIINNGEQGVTWTSGNAFNLSFTITYLSV